MSKSFTFLKTNPNYNVFLHFQCTECGRQFAQQHQLKTHFRIHTGENPYSCPHCPQKFRHLSTRNNHKCDGKTAATNAITTAIQKATITLDENNEIQEER